MGCETGSGHTPPRVSIAGGDGDGRVKRCRKRCTTTEKSLPRGCAPLSPVDRALPPCRESKCARSGAPPRRSNTAVEADRDLISAKFRDPRLERTPLHPFLASGVVVKPRSRRSPPMSRSSLPPVLYAVPAPANRQTDRDHDTGKLPPRPTIKLRVRLRGRRPPCGRPPPRHRPLRKNTRTLRAPRGADFAIYSFSRVALRFEFNFLFSRAG